MAKENFIISQISHWIYTPQNAYLGSNYGVDLYQYLQSPLTTQVADEIVAKMRQDIPALASIADDELQIFTRTKHGDTLILIISVLGLAIEVDSDKLAAQQV